MICELIKQLLAGMEFEKLYISSGKKAKRNTHGGLYSNIELNMLNSSLKKLNKIAFYSVLLLFFLFRQAK